MAVFETGIIVSISIFTQKSHRFFEEEKKKIALSLLNTMVWLKNLMVFLSDFFGFVQSRTILLL